MAQGDLTANGASFVTILSGVSEIEIEARAEGILAALDKEEPVAPVERRQESGIGCPEAEQDAAPEETPGQKR
jgi:hypothetical protein